MTASLLDWQTENQRYLATALEEVQILLSRYVAQQQGETVSEETLAAPETDTTEPEVFLISSPALDYVCDAFGLTVFERQVLLLCAGVELSATIARLCATVQGNAQFTYPTFSLALAAFPEAQWEALAPVAPLRRWRLIELVGEEGLTQSRLRIDERVLHYLTGMFYLDERLQGMIRPVAMSDALPPSQQQLAQRLVHIWSRDEVGPVIQLVDSQPETCAAIAAVACGALGQQLYRLRAIDMPTVLAEREALTRLWEREAILSQGALLVDCEGASTSQIRQMVVPFLEGLGGQVVVMADDPVLLRQRPMVQLEVPRASVAEQRLLWQQALAAEATDLNGALEGIVSQFHLSASTIQAIGAAVPVEDMEPEALVEQLWDTCRLQARPRLDNLAQRIVPRATWEDLVLPKRECLALREIAAQVRQQAKVYDTWEFVTRGSNGLGISTLFAGPSGTGKTLAAEVLAHELRLDLYRIDLSQVVSKYIGETEKNLRQVFNAAEAGGAILLFDEADALFGKRSDVKDSHDRYANIEVSYLLQRMEAYRGLAILTTNLKTAIDTAFLRRLRFLVQFPFPNGVQRQEIWQRIFPASLPTDGLDWERLAQLNITGGNIRTIALNGAFLAADEGTAVQMRHLLQSARTEYAKLEKTLTDAEVRGWV